jgi:hypothetical protein
VKRCTRCGREQKLLAFRKDPRSGDGLQCYCAGCMNVIQQKWRRAHPKQVKVQSRKTHLSRHYGITVDEYDALMASQGGVCAICGRTETQVNQWGVKRLSVDHDHTTGRVRGLLCSACNRGLGQFQDNLTRLVRAASYLANNTQVMNEGGTHK